MAITDSRNKGGTLTLDALPFQKQLTNVTLEPEVEEEGDALEVLSGDQQTPDEVTRWALALGAVQDFEDPAGFIEFCRANAGQVVPFEWEPNGPTGVGYSGVCKVRATTIGGDVATRLTASPSFPVVGEPIPTYPTP